VAAWLCSPWRGSCHDGLQHHRCWSIGDSGPTVSEPPSGTVTLLFADIEGSTWLWEQHPDAMATALAQHDELLRAAVESCGGHVVKTTGDGLFAAFARADSAVAAALAAQNSLAAATWGVTGRLRVRMGLNTGHSEFRDGDYHGSAVNRAARLSAAGHGDQVLVSGATEAVVGDALPQGADLADLGEHRLRDLARPMRVFQLLHSTLPAKFPPIRSLDALPGNLPRQLTSFVGREDEVGRLSALVGDHSLVTLTGVGGVGKTRLAIEVAAEVAPAFPDGVWVCELAPVTDPAAVLETLAATLDVRPYPGRALGDTVLEYLTPKQLLIVLDNCEHLLAAVADLVEEIVKRCPRAAVLATSREGLALPGEQIVAVPALELPQADAGPDAIGQAEAVRLFCDRAVAANADFALTARNSTPVAQLCRRLDGIPLAIELAAARVRSLSPEDLVSRLNQRFKLLTRGSRASLERHQTLRNAIDWSYDLLSEPERVALRRMSVFAGSFDLAAAEAVVSAADIDSSDVVDLLTPLVDKSLLDVEPVAGGVRYRLLETIRQYAQERLEASGETSALRGRHLAHYLGLAENAGPHLRSHQQLAWASALALETDNFRAALDWAVEATLYDEGLRLVIPLMVTGIPIGWLYTDWADVARSIPGASTHELFPLAAAYAAMGLTMRGELDRAAELVATAQAAQTALGTAHLWVHAAAGALASFQGDAELARQHAEAWVKLARARNDTYELAHALILLAPALGGDPAQAAVAEQAVRASRQIGVASTLLYALLVQGLALTEQNPERALRSFQEAADVAASVGDRYGAAVAIANQGAIALTRRDWDTALRAYAAGVEQHLQLGRPVAGELIGVATALVGMECLEPAAVIFGLEDAMFGGHLVALSVPDDLANSAEEAVAAAFDPDRLTALKARGAALDLPSAVAYLRSEVNRILADGKDIAGASA
jgi:predicted ATPase/class 3 adenylate cyclase